ncbi:MAG: hypothetical protein WBA57_09365 [Elainellaceae cyanobacterium]
MPKPVSAILSFLHILSKRLQPKQLQPHALSPHGLSMVGVLGWMAIATLLRFHHLTFKPLWTDEMSTLVFGLGHSFRDIPLGQAIAPETLLAPLQYTPDTSPLDSAQRLLTESNHPPLYFMLTHAWLHLWHSLRVGLGGLGSLPAISPEYVSVWDARSLSAVAGVAAVPATYGLGWLAFRSRTVAHLAAALMAVSPFGIYLAQDARHYTLAVLWMIGSLACLVVAIRTLRHQKPLPLPIVFAWIGVNGLGMATHYFFLLTLLAEFVVLLGAIAHHLRFSAGRWHIGLGRLGLAIAGTAATGLVWLPFLLAIRQDDGLTRWIYDDGGGGWDWIYPLGQTLASVVSMIFLLPVQNIGDGLAFVSGFVILAMSVWTGWLLVQHFKEATANSDLSLSLRILAGFVGGAIAIILLLTYGFGVDMAQVFRYHFVYFPAVIVTLAAGLAPLWHPAHSAPNVRPDSQGLLNKIRFRLTHPGRFFIGLMIVMGMAGSLTVAYDFGYRKLHRPDWVVQEMAERYEVSTVVAISHQTHGQTGRLMAIAWEMRSPKYREQFESVEFFLDPQTCSANSEQNCGSPSQALRASLTDHSQPFDVWLINFEGNANLKPQGCDYLTTKRTDGYKFQQYQCPTREDVESNAGSSQVTLPNSLSTL